MSAELHRRGVSRYQFAEQAADAKVCTNYTASSLLAADGTVRGGRKPSFEIAIQLAELLGCELILVIPTPATKKAPKKSAAKRKYEPAPYQIESPEAGRVD